MNKKFSTLVAALLVTGGSFAMVSQYTGSALAESPLAKAAAANLRATDNASEAKASVFMSDQVTSPNWTLTVVSGGATISSGNFNLAVVDGALELSKSAKASVITLDNGFVKIGTQYVVVNGNTLALGSSADNAVKLFDEDRDALSELPASEAGRVYIAKENVNNNVLFDAAVNASVKQASTFDAEHFAAANYATTTNTVFKVASVDGSSKTFKLAVGERYVAEDNGKLVLVGNVESATSFSCYSGYIYNPIGNRYIVVDENGSISLAAGTQSLKPIKKENGTAIATGDNKSIENITQGLEIFLAKGTTESDLALNFVPDAYGTLAVTTVTEGEPLKVTGVQGTTGFTLKVSETEGYLTVRDASVGLSGTGTEFYSDDNLYIKSGNKFLSNNNGALVLAATSENGLKAYKNGSAVTLSAEALVIGVAVESEKSMDTEKAAMSFDATANLVDGKIYMIQGANKSLAMVKGSNGKYSLGSTAQHFGEGSILRSDVTVESINGILWKTTKTIVAGKAVYSFVNVATGKPLAFAENTTKNGVVFDVEGKYNTFMLEGEGLVFTYTSTGTTGARSYYVNPSDGTVGDYASVTFATADPVETGDYSDDVNAAVKLLNVTYGAGNGFGVMFKDRELSEEKVKDVTLESNPFSDNTIITAVQGWNFTNVVKDGEGKDLTGKMFLKVAGAYPLTDDNAEDEDQLDAFRNSTFIAVDTVRYSAFVNDINADNNFYKYTTVKGSQMLNGNGDSYDGTTISSSQLKKGGKWYGVTRRIENAQFKISQAAGATVEDAIEFIVPEAYIPAVNNGAEIALNGHNGAAVEDLKLAIKQFNKKNYVGALKGESWPYIYIGLNNDVDYKTINGIVTIVSRNYKTDGQPYATTLDENGLETIDAVLAKYASLDKPEGQFLVTGGDGTPFQFQNRESGLFFEVGNVDKVNLKKTDKKNVYSIVGTKDTVEIKAAAAGDEFVGYANYNAKALENTAFVLKVVSNVAGIQDIYIAEDHNKDHSLGLNADTLEAANFKLVKFEGGAVDEAAYDKLYGDTVFVSKGEYSYVAVDKKTKEKYYDTTDDYVVAFTYAIYNADNGEFLAINEGKGVTKAEYLYCNPEQKGMGYKDVAQRFIIKEKANGAIQLIPVKHLDARGKNIFRTDAATGGDPIYFYYDPEDDNELALSKLYSGISDNKIYENTDGIYKVADNDLFTIQEIGAPLYRTLENEVYDKVRIYKEGTKNVALFAESADKALVSGQNWLGMEHKADADLNKTMFSFVLDTAYVDRGEKNYKPEYLLAIDSEVIPSVKYCDEHGINPDPDCGHTTQTIAYMKGSYLVNLADSAAAWDKNAHVNPYKYGDSNRLGFVKATHVKDQLIIERGAPTLADTLNLTKGNSAKFALKIVDQATKSFVLENNGKYLKWLNGVPVMVGDFTQAEVLNIEATENAATANEAIEAAGVQVIGGQGVVTVQGAAGKVITVANILGQTIANQVAASDNVTIAAPAGVLVVTVDGEATKVVVK